MASTALSVAQAVHTYKIGKMNVKAEKKLGELRADERRDKLRRTLAAQRVALTSQGRDPDFGSSLVLYEESRKAAELESAVDSFQTGRTIENIKGQSISSTIKTIGGAGQNLLKASEAAKQKKVA